jgi:hypothetical protein
VNKDFNDKAVPRVATKAELLHRLRQRAAPKIERALTPIGATRTVSSAHSNANEMRIRDLRETLGTARQKLRQGFARTKRIEIER